MASETPVKCSITICSQPSAVADVCKLILPQLQANGFEQDDIFAIHLALEEAFQNAVEHGNKMDPNKKVQIDYFINAEKFEISVTDEGHGFKPEEVPDPRLGDNIYRPDGRGVLLINSYMDVVKYNERGNSVRMIRYKATQNSAENKELTDSK